MINRSVFLFAFFFPLAATFLLCPIVRRVAIRLDAIDRPDKVRHVHAVPTPRLGGLALAYAMSFALPFTVFYFPRLVNILLGGGVLLLAGMFDDIHGLSPSRKLLFQVLAALLALYPAVDLILLLPAAIFVVITINGMNLIDGLDGLAAGYGTSASLTLTLLALQLGHTDLALPFPVLAGSCLGFLPHNLRKKKLFLGDTGSQLIGYYLSVFALPFFSEAPGALCLILFYPIAELLVSLIRRLKQHRHPFTADRGHLHHRLLDLGLPQGIVVRLLLTVCLLLNAAAIVSLLSPLIGILFLLMETVAFAIRLTMSRFPKRHNGKPSGHKKRSHRLPSARQSSREEQP
ncbi:MAG: undecaprenyl/decaprenyl-phosphate alpha-N-acetylglucosaminyl 1-phosphate transferase [Ruminococcaceae bacterium]|nr:undecaprenyl/decaprenyl-phosphate alpha-N-acetylglucosaminyl 1-phosphate transferase [Oscillospiraceae bacterium]